MRSMSTYVDSISLLCYHFLVLMHSCITLVTLILCLRYRSSETDRVTIINTIFLSFNLMQNSCKVHCMTVLATYFPWFTGEVWCDLREIMVQRQVRIGNFSFQENVIDMKNSISGLKRNSDERKRSSKLWDWPTFSRADAWTLQTCKAQWCLVFQAS